MQAQRELLAELQREKINSAKTVAVSGRPIHGSSSEVGPGSVSLVAGNKIDESGTESDTLRQGDFKATNLVAGGLHTDLSTTDEPGTRDLDLSDSPQPALPPLDHLGIRGSSLPGPGLRRNPAAESSTESERAFDNNYHAKQANTFKERRRMFRLPSPDLIIPLPSAELIGLHAHLVNRLISALRKPEYQKLDIDQLHRLREAVLEAHFEEWKPFADTTFETTLADHLKEVPILRNSWVKRCKEERNKNAEISLGNEFKEELRTTFSQVAYTMQGIVYLMEVQHATGSGQYGIRNGPPRPWSKIHRMHIDTRTLEYYHIPWEWDKAVSVSY